MKETEISIINAERPEPPKSPPVNPNAPPLAVPNAPTINEPQPNYAPHLQPPHPFSVPTPNKPNKPTTPKFPNEQE
ncbi:MAG TPA: hypothetical protein VN922_04710 [Bacteroidia bacterium]|nr:hypothetical protein [Bacteroidia bacterium]